MKFRKIVLACIMLLLSFSISTYAQVITINKVHYNILDSYIAGTESGLFLIQKNGTSVPLWQEGSVKKILNVEKTFYLLTSEGIIKTENFLQFDKLNSGLPTNLIKKINGTEVKYIRQQKDLKDLAIHPEEPNIMVTATKDAVYLTKDGGATWQNIGLNAKTSGVKSLAVFDQPFFDAGGNKIGTELVVYLSHAIYGFSYYRANDKNAEWVDMEKGFENLPGQNMTDEIASMYLEKNSTTGEYDLYLGASFIPRIYKLNWQEKKVDIIWTNGDKNATQDNLIKIYDKFVYLGLEGFKAIDANTKIPCALPENIKAWENIIALKDDINCLHIPKMRFAGKNYPEYNIEELWMLKKINSKYSDKIHNIRGIYIPPNHISDERLDKYFTVIKDNNLNAIVVDMKDDKGLLRFDAKTELVKDLGTESQYAVKLDDFVKKCKENDVYLIARVVVFKDRNLFRYKKGKYSVWDKKKNESWRGTRGIIETKDDDGKVISTETDYYDEYWVDPYCQKVWEYNVAVAKELIERGFNEIQFDYIRFPTDGNNLANAQYRFYENGMDRESTLISFLSYARENIDAPIGIDIYGSNGWYRSGARTGQDVEMMSNYVDIISPMFYPSHFEQNFLDYEPAIERPFRIYDFGSYRSTIIGRNKIIVRPWIQAFYLNCIYDRKYYNKTYVKKEIEGVKNTIDDGYLFWNNIGRYEDIYQDDIYQNTE